MLDKESHNLLASQAKKLRNLAKSMKEWHGSTYGDVIRFCDSSTFEKVVRLWNFYTIRSSQGQAFREQQQTLRTSFERAEADRNKNLKDRDLATAHVSAIPCAVIMAHDIQVEKFGNLHSEYWRTGVAFRDKQIVAESQHLNPLFGSLSSTRTLYYGFDPFHGFHLATAYAPIVKDSPLRPGPLYFKNLSEAARAAMTEFHAWSQAFRKHRGQLVLRFVASDAVSFCHILRHHRIHRESKPAFWYRDQWQFDQLVLDSEDYSPKASAPSTFDVIDTSNLGHHLGPLNVLTACAPILSRKGSSTLYTEMLSSEDEGREAYAEGLLSSDLATVSLILGLKPVQYWSNIATRAIYGEDLASGGVLNTVPSRYIMCWKSTAESTVTFDGYDLGRFVYKMYLQMFREEKWLDQIDKGKNQLVDQRSQQYTRGGFAALLGLIKHSNLTLWDGFIELLIDKIENDKVLKGANRSMQDLYVHLDLFGLHAKVTDSPEMIELRSDLTNTIHQSWEDVPSILWLTLVVPRKKLHVFQSESASAIDGPICHLVIRSSYGLKQEIFADIQLGFGEISTTGAPNSANFAITVREDEKEWQGETPLIVSAAVPAWMVLGEANLSAEVMFCLKSTPSTYLLAPTLGHDLEIHKSSWASPDVFITANPPNLEGFPSVFCDFKELQSESSFGELIQDSLASSELSALKSPKVALYALFDDDSTRIKGLKVHVDLKSTEFEELLDEVIFGQFSPWKIELVIRKSWFHQSIQLPVPVAAGGCDTRASKRLCYVEFTCPVYSPGSLTSRTDAMFPFLLDNGAPILESLSCMALDRLPVLDLGQTRKLSWMHGLLSSMFSVREQEVCRNCIQSRTISKDVHVNFKRSLSSMFLHLAGLGGRDQCQYFCLKNPNIKGTQLLIFASSMRLDVTNQSITLDVALLPQTPENALLMLGFMAHKKIKSHIKVIQVDDNELVLWQHAVPAFAEHCRDWEHESTCEYAAKGASVPLSTGAREKLMCSCGLGKFPEGYNAQVPTWDKMSSRCVRAAISPCFAVPYVEDCDVVRAYAKKCDAEEDVEELENLALDDDDDNEDEEERCFACKKSERGDGAAGDLMKCGKCRVALYCSRECQEKDWKEGGHKRACKTMAGR